MKEICVGVDVGGTSVKMGFFTTDGQLIRKWEIETRRRENCEHVIEDIAESIRENLKKDNLTLNDCVGIGMGVPGPVLPKGYVEVCVNLGWKDMYPARELSDRLEGISVRVGNDANIAALGEAWQGGAKRFNDVVMLTLGTGVGGGIIINGEIVTGRHGLAGEIGHLYVRSDEKDCCNCGGHGCLEQVASATGIVKEAKRQLAESDMESSLRDCKKLTAKEVLDAAKAGDALAEQVMDVVVKYLGIAISHIALTVDPDVFVIGGGVSKAGQYLIDKIKVMYDFYTPISKNRGDIVLATLGNDAGIYGAAKMCLC